MNKADNVILLAGVIGDPISHSKSPKLHNFWLKQYNINGYYIPIQTKVNQLEKTLQSLIHLGFRGVNVTIPHKETVLTLANTVTDRASIIGAANTLYFNTSGKITADNTDGYGFKQNIYQNFPTWEPKKSFAVVFGSGGAARAIVYTLLAEGVPKVKLLNRTKSKASSIAESFGNKVEVIDWYAYEEAFKGAAVIVNTTSLGMVSQPKLKVNLKSVANDTLIVDLVYNPLETELLIAAKSIGLKTIDGLGMLLHQAELGFSNWFNHNPVINDEVRQHILNENE